MLHTAILAKALFSAFFLGIACLPSGWCCSLTPCNAAIQASKTKTSDSSAALPACCKSGACAEEPKDVPANSLPCKSCKCQPAISAGLPVETASASVDFPVASFSLDQISFIVVSIKPSESTAFIVASPLGLQFLRERCRWNC